MTQTLRYTKILLTVRISQELRSYLPGVSQCLVLKTFRICRIRGNSDLLINSLPNYSFESFHEEKGNLGPRKKVLRAKTSGGTEEKKNWTVLLCLNPYRVQLCSFGKSWTFTLKLKKLCDRSINHVMKFLIPSHICPWIHILVFFSIFKIRHLILVSESNKKRKKKSLKEQISNSSEISVSTLSDKS